MLHFFKLRQDLFDPEPAKDVYVKRPAGRGWPEECPPVRGANSFGFDLLANFDVSFVRSRSTDSGWKIENDVVIESDFDYAGSEDSPGAPLTQQYAWFWEKGQKIPHPITDNVYEVIRNQVKVSSFLFLKTDPNELLLITDVPNRTVPFKNASALIDTDWYPASYPWHVAIDLDPSQKRIEIKRGDPLCRIIPVRRDTYFAQQMSPTDFDAFFERGQKWLQTHGRAHQEEKSTDPTNPPVMDITRTYVRQQVKSKFVVMT